MGGQEEEGVKASEVCLTAQEAVRVCAQGGALRSSGILSLWDEAEVEASLLSTQISEATLKAAYTA